MFADGGLFGSVTESPGTSCLLQSILVVYKPVMHNVLVVYGCVCLQMVACLGQLLRVQEQAVWSEASTIHIYNTLLGFISHPKPKASATKTLPFRLFVSFKNSLVIPLFC